jgi:chromosome segregation protein
MYLKRLEVHGFKSFASPTRLEFGTGVTAVAGPNGAGKTNVAEAIRWVLGEHASRVIRARKTEDVIFSGSAKRSALGMAEVKITLDNSDHWLPVDFDEVVVSRRAYRSGENEYYINQARVRLRDVTELFMKAQVGQNSYAFMGQGLVEQVLTLRPEERRGMIEEAADVRLHRERLDEARNRLSATRDNLDRVRMLVSEIEPRLRQLERQADRALSYARLSTELTQTLRELYGRQWQDAQEAIAGAQAALDQRKEAFDVAQRDALTLEEGASSLGGAIEEQQRDIAGLDEAFRQQQEYTRELQRRITLDDEREIMLAARQEEIATEIASAQQDRGQLSTLIHQLDERTKAIEEQLAAARAPEAAVAELDEIDTRLREVRAALSQAEHRANQAQTQLGEAEGRAAAITSQQDRLANELRSLANARHEPLAALKSWARELADRRQRMIELRPAAERALHAFAETKAELEETASNVERRKQEIDRLGVEIEAAQARYELAQGVDAELPAPDAGVRAVLAAGGRIPGEEPSPDTRVHGVVGMLGEVLRVPSGLERAIEAALAESLHAIIVENQEDALAAVELLISEDAGRATILSMRDVRPTPPVNILEERGVLGVASDLVRCEGRYRPLVNTLLGRTIVAQNLGIAKAILRRGMGNVVTLDGILLRQNGAMTAGSSRAIRAALVHQREVSELPAELEASRDARQQAENALRGGEQRLAELQKQHEQVAPEAERLQVELTNAEEHLTHHRSRLPALAARLVALRIHQSDAQRSLLEGEPALASARETVERAQAELRQHETARTQLREQLEELTARRDAVASSLANRTSRITSFEEEQRGLEQQRRVQSGALGRVDQEIARRQELATRVEEDLAGIVARLASTRDDLAQKTLELDAAREELAPARNSLEQLTSRQRTIGDELAAARSRSLAAERALLDAEAALRLRNDELQVLKDRLEEEGFSASIEGDLLAKDGETPPTWLTTEAQESSETMPPVRGGADVDTAALREQANTLRAQIRRLGPVNEQAGEDYAENKERHDFLSGQLTDLSEAEASLQEAIDELERIVRERFSTTFQRVNTEFTRYFTTFFNGGHAELQLSAPDEHGLPGVDIAAQPPRKRVRTLAMLSGGERSLTALALLFALLQTNPSPICVLDEVDAALDESNVDRFSGVLHELSERTQFIIITHNRRTLEIADTIYGVSMGEDSVSTLLSLRLADISKN